MKDQNPIFDVKISGLKAKVYLSDLRNIFRQYLDSVGLLWLKGQTNNSTVTCFCAVKNIDVTTAQKRRLITAFTVDMTRKRKGFPFGELTGDMLAKWKANSQQ